MKELVISTIKSHELIEDGDTIVLGLSGGADSLALLNILGELRGELNFKLIAAHLNHGIRGEEAEADALFSQRAAEKANVTFVKKYVDVPSYAKSNGLTEEEAGRKLRYEFFAELADEYGARKIAVAHHADDQVETILFNMLRGSSLTGLCGMAYKAPLGGEKKLLIIRPLLDVKRNMIEEYLLQNGQKSWCKDCTNLANDYSRNRLRNIIIPELKAINSRACEHILDVSKDAYEATRYIDAKACELFKARYGDETLDISEFERVPEFLAKKVIYKFICICCGRKKDIERSHVDMVYELTKLQSGRVVDLPYDVSIKKSYNSLISKKRQEISPEKENLTIDLVELMKVEQVEAYGYAIKAYERPADFTVTRDADVKFFDLDALALQTKSLAIRKYEEGDYFCPFTDGRRKSLSRYFIDEKIEDREDINVLAFGEHVIYLLGLRSDESFRIGELTKNILEIRRLL